LEDSRFRGKRGVNGKFKLFLPPPATDGKRKRTTGDIARSFMEKMGGRKVINEGGRGSEHLEGGAFIGKIIASSPEKGSAIWEKASRKHLTRKKKEEEEEAERGPTEEGGSTDLIESS